jgi:serine/threonine protein kinase
MLMEYRIESELGTGGFGITYLAYDTHLNIRVAIKEYLPGDLAMRDDTTGAVHPKTTRMGDDYDSGLHRFLLEARTLASLRHPNIVGVHRFFEANNTAYMVMAYEYGESLNSWLKKYLSRGEGTPSEALLKRMFTPLLEGLQRVHDSGFLHRDIKPANIYVRDGDGSLVLLDFGAARLASGAVSAEGLTSIVTPGYAPFEQYHTHGRQGPWSDLYALGGVLYWFVTGKKPIEAGARVRSDPQESASELGRGRYGENFLRAIDWALAPDDMARPQSVPEFLPALFGDAPAVSPAPAAAGAGGSQAAPPEPAAWLSSVSPSGTLPPSASPPASSPSTTLSTISPATAPGATPAQPRAGRRRWSRAAIAGLTTAVLLAGLFAVWRSALAPSLSFAVQTGAVAQSATETDDWIASLKPFDQALTQAAGRTVSAVSIGDFGPELEAGTPRHDLYLAPLDKIGPAVRRLHLTPVVKFRDFAVTLIVRPASPITRLADLQGRSLALYPADSTHGPITLHWLMSNDVKTELIKFKVSSSPDAMMDALLFGRIDAVALPQYSADQVLARYPDKLKAMGKSEAYPGFVLALAPRVPEEQAARLQQVLLAMHQTPAGLAALKDIRVRQVAGTVALERTSATEVVTAAERLERVRKLYPREALLLEPKATK